MRGLEVVGQVLEAEEAVVLRVDAGEVVTLAEGRGLARYGRGDAAPGQALTALLPAGSEALAAWRRCLAGERVRAEAMHGQVHWLQLFTPLRGPDGAPAGAAMVAIDVTADLDEARQARLLRELVNNVPTNVFAIRSDGICVISEGGLLAKLGLEPGQNVGLDVLQTYKQIPVLLAGLQAAFAGEARTIEYPYGDVLIEQTNLPWRDANGAVVGAFCVAADIAEQRRDQELLREQVRIIQEQKQAILRLSSPIIEVGEDVLAVPLVGAVDGDRAAIVMHGLLEAIAHKRARFAILDLTGVETVDPGTAEHLVRIIHSVRLLGAEAIVTGIRPAIAQTLAGLGLDLGGLTTLRSLRDGLRHAAGGR